MYLLGMRVYTVMIMNKTENRIKPAEATGCRFESFSLFHSFAEWERSERKPKLHIAQSLETARKAPGSSRREFIVDLTLGAASSTKLSSALKVCMFRFFLSRSLDLQKLPLASDVMLCNVCRHVNSWKVFMFSEFRRVNLMARIVIDTTFANVDETAKSGGQKTFPLSFSVRQRWWQHPCQRPVAKKTRKLPILYKSRIKEKLFSLLMVGNTGSSVTVDDKSGRSGSLWFVPYSAQFLERKLGPSWVLVLTCWSERYSSSTSPLNQIGDFLRGREHFSFLRL